MTQPMPQSAIDKMIEAGQEVEMTFFNEKFKGYPDFDWDKQLKIRRNARARITRLLNRYGYEAFNQASTDNEDLAYALQFC